MTDFNAAADNHVCVVGAGPAGVVLALVLARNGIPVTLIESQVDFDRDFRGDTLHASSLEIMAQLGLAESVLQLANSRIERLQLGTTEGQVTIADFSLLDSDYKYVAIVHQARFLEHLVNEARQYPNFRVYMQTTFTDFVRDGDTICGIKCITDNTPREIPAALVVGADGRNSAIRQQAGIELVRTAPPMDVLWFKLPKRGDVHFGHGVEARFGSGTMAVIIDRGDEWQGGYVIMKGSFREIRQAGIESFRTTLGGLLPELAESINTLDDWSKSAMLSVVTGRVDQWCRSGLLLIGDAAHVMSPVGGVGINYAIQDAVAAANLLLQPLQDGRPGLDVLEQMQGRREKAIRFIQFIQTQIQNRIVAQALREESFRPPLALRLLSRLRPFRKRMAINLAYGLKPELLEARWLG